ncbi:E3 ubiquitin-protein ligase SHPRH [Galendromus occidentalis]|uniref:E3 ubiquitin-protein ligase SHPRH n=1 Tax=Galendromus occidentalis TaxID=34638 RepID=A0AAJ6QWU1_9ACAR|nr:E3 ubiquitin-protein ligase SHPRH [Galendromus occidentalis]
MESAPNLDGASSAAGSSRRKREAPSRLDESSQQRLSWCARQTEPPEEEIDVDEIGQSLPAPETPSKKRKSAGSSIISMISKHYDHSVKLIPTAGSHSTLFQLGEFNLTGSNLDPSLISTGAYWTVDKDKDMHVLWELGGGSEIRSCKVSTDLPEDVVEALLCRNRRFQAPIISIQGSSELELNLAIFIPESLVPVLASRLEAVSCSGMQDMKKLVSFFHNVSYRENTTTLEDSEDYDRLFQTVLDDQRSQGILPISTPVYCPLKVTLRDYQREAVAWMCRMETEPQSEECEELWRTIEDKRGRSVYYNRFLGCFARSIPPAHNKVTFRPGGILADEMGLGKTLEVIALVLSRPRPGFPVTDEDTGIVIEEDKKEACRYTCGSCNSSVIASCPANVSAKCPQCWASSETLFPIRATLIVCPASICEQWTDEINWLVGECSLRVFVYQGVRHHGYVPPDRLNKFDLIITTYGVLRKEIYHANVTTAPADGQRRLRTPKRHKAMPSPLVSAEFWRVALDEAQMVESSTVKAAQMVLSIPAINRWCVTGTPIHKDLNDIFGLFVFLRVAPYDQMLWFRELILKPYYSGDMSTLVKTMTKCFRRMSKKEVWDQLNLPAQHTHMNELQFSPAEEVFYKTQTVICYEDAYKVAKRFPWYNIISKMPRSDVIKLMEPLKRLRQACSHPKAVRGSEISLKNSSYTMDDLLTALIKRSVREAEEAQRRIISSLNGLAGLALLRREPLVAADFYRQVLWSISYYSGNLRADPLQQFHTYVNLAALIEENDQQMRTAGGLAAGRWNGQEAPNQSGYGVRGVTSDWQSDHQFNPVPLIPRATGDDKLMEHAYQVRDKYLSKYGERQRQAMLSVTNYRNDLQKLSDRFRLPKEEKWYISFIDGFQAKDDGERLIQKLKEHLVENKGAYGLSLVNRFTDCNGLKYVIQNHLDALYESRGHLMKVIDQFASDPSKEDIQAAISCHLRPIKKKRPRCRYCLVQDILLAYESKLFSCDPLSPKKEESEAEQEVDEDDNAAAEDLTRGDGVTRKGTWQLSDVEKIVIYLAALTKTNNESEDIQFDGALHCEYLSLLRKEFKSFGACYRQTKDYVAALDELEMAALKFELAPDDKIFKNSEKPANVVHLWEIDAQAARLHNDKKLGEEDLCKCLHQLVYLRTLEKTSSMTEGSTEECPTCRSALGERWRVFHCGHNICIECLQMLIKTQCPVVRSQTSVRVQCPMCRVYSKLEDIFHVDTRRKENEPSNIKVIGSHSTKVTGVVENLIRIRNQDPLMKCIVFSLWPSVLFILQKAFAENNISNVLVASTNQLQRNLRYFKKNPQISVLLMPIKLGSKGLNLTEASHMILIEPVLDSGDELQALGRIHRIGQNKETHVHRFIVKNTIEEKLIKFTKGAENQETPIVEREKEEEGMTVAKMLTLLTQEKDRYTNNNLSSL